MRSVAIVAIVASSMYFCNPAFAEEADSTGQITIGIVEAGEMIDLVESMSQNSATQQEWWELISTTDWSATDTMVADGAFTKGNFELVSAVALAELPIRTSPPSGFFNFPGAKTATTSLNNQYGIVSTKPIQRGFEIDNWVKIVELADDGSITGEAGWVYAGTGNDDPYANFEPALDMFVASQF